MYKKISLMVKKHGLLNSFIYKVNVILSKLSNNNVRLMNYYFFAQPITDQCVIRNASKRRIKIYMPESDDLIFAQCPRPKAVIEERFKQKSKCFVATKDDQFVGFIWFSEEKYIEDEVRCEIVPRPVGVTAWDYDIYVNPKNRLGMAFPMLWDRVNQYLSQKGYKWTMSRISPINSASLSTHKKLGAIYSGQALFLCLWQVQIMGSSLPPYVHISTIKQPKIHLLAPLSPSSKC